MIVCPRCGKENQDHYKFCLGCGAELPRDAAHAPKSFTAPTPPAGFQGGGGGAPAAGFGGAPAAGFGGAPGNGGAPAAGFGGAPGNGGAPAAGFGATPAAPAQRPAGGAAGGFGPPPSAPSFGGSPAAPASGPVFGGAAVAPSPSFGSSAPGGLSPAPAGTGDSVICGKCGNPNNKNFKFCGTCGHPLQASMPAPAMPAAAPAPSAGPKRGSLVLIRPDGSEGDSFTLGDVTPVGRESGGLFASDSYLSPRHATFTFGPGGLSVKDEGSLNGIYIRIAADTPTELRDGAVFRIGQEIVRFERLKSSPPQNGVEIMGSPSAGLVGRICLLIGREATGNCYAIPATGLHLGRERGDILFPDDGYVSGLHCRLHEEGGRMLLTDVGSSNGTFVRMDGAAQLPSGSLLLMGQQLFRAEY